ncbi:MAG: YIP1 family protein [Phycisphaerales bacterium]|nr:YIP1 family protein [Phycisphaerales bacterium]
MRCKQCDYALWNLPARTCPECGTPFQPTDFDFVPSAVQFCCPGCTQPYYGTTSRGHLVPMEFDCVRCGRHMHMNEAICLPTQGVHESLTLRGDNPWLDRRRPIVSRFFGGIGRAMSNPADMARGTPADASLPKAAAFALLCHLSAYAITWSPMLALMLIGGGLRPGLIASAMLIGMCLGVSLVGMWVWAVAAHVALRLTGKTAGGFRRTMLALYYASGANFISAVPCVGFMFGWIWWSVSATLMLTQFQRVGGLRATVAGVLPPVALVVALGFGQYWLNTLAMRAAAARPVPGTTAAAIPSPPNTAPDYIAATARGGVVALAELDASPTHPGELVLYNYIPVSGVASNQSATTDRTATIAGESLWSLDTRPPGERGEAFRRAIKIDMDAADRPWRRLGDLLLPSLAGVNVDQTRDAGLWVLAVSPDPATGPAYPDGTRKPQEWAIWVIGVEGPAERIGPDELDARLAEQNAARAGLGLPALDDPRAVGH